MTTISNDWAPDFDMIHDSEREMRAPEVVHPVKTDSMGFTLCEHCGSRILDSEREDSMLQYGYPVCFRCMADMQIEKDSIEDLVEREKVRQQYLNKYWRGCR